MPDHPYVGSIIVFRNDRLGARLMTMLNAIRIAQDYDIPYYFVWKTDGRTSEELMNPTQIFDAGYFADHEVPIDVYRDAVPMGVDLQLLPADTTADDLRAKAADGNVLMCTGSNLMVLPWETAADVAPRYAAAIHTLRFSPQVLAAMKAVDAVLADRGTAFHIRRGDIIYDPITSNQLWSNKYIPREFYEVLAERLIADPAARVLVFSDEPEEITRLKALNTNNADPQILGAADVIPDTLTIAQRDFIELYAMSRCGMIYGPPSSGFSMTAALMGDSEIKDVRDALDAAEQDGALDRLVARLQKSPDRFLSDGDIGQSLPFALNYLNRTDRSGVALKILQSYRRRGLSKTSFFQLLLRQNMIEGHYKTPAALFKTMTTVPMDIAIPGRLENHWGEMNRLAAVASAHAGDAGLAQQHITNAVWYAATHRPTILTLSQLWAGGHIAPESFAIPFDMAVSRPVPSQTADLIAAREGHAALLPPGQDGPQIVMPIDLIALDWHLFLGKSLNRGFSQPDMTQRSITIFKTQFARLLAPDVVASVLGLYAHTMGQTDQALAYLDIALAARPDHPLLLKRAGLVRIAADADDPSGPDLLARAADIGGVNSLYAAQLADYQWTSRQRPRALRTMQTLCDAGTSLPELPYICARMMRQSRQSNNAALAYIDAALKIAPHVRRFMSLRAHILFDMQNTKAGLEAVDKIADRFGDKGDVSTLRARAG
jgi:hypothetical protein